MFKNYPKVALVFVIIFAATNLLSASATNNDLSLENKQLAVKYITQDSNGQSFKVDMVTSPGLNTGYKYLFWLEKVDPIFDYSANTLKSYKIVAPKTIARPEEITISFGSVGVIKL